MKNLSSSTPQKISLKNIRSFFDKNFIKTHYFHSLSVKKETVNKTSVNEKSNTKHGRRNFLKSALGASTLVAGSTISLSAQSALSSAPAEEINYQQLVKQDPWLTLDAVLNHLLPASESALNNQKHAKDISAVDIKATEYLINVVYQQPTKTDEIQFLYQGITWLNDFSQSKHQQAFVMLSTEQKQELLKAISKSTAGENWLNNLIEYLYEAMLSAPSYGGNPNGVGWQWLEHQAGYPLPPEGKRYFELPGKHRRALNNKSAKASALDFQKHSQHKQNQHKQNRKKA